MSTLWPHPIAISPPTNAPMALSSHSLGHTPPPPFLPAPFVILDVVGDPAHDRPAPHLPMLSRRGRRLTILGCFFRIVIERIPIPVATPPHAAQRKKHRAVATSPTHTAPFCPFLSPPPTSEFVNYVKCLHSRSNRQPARSPTFVATDTTTRRQICHHAAAPLCK